MNVGDYVFVKREPTPGVSKRFQSPHHDNVYQVVECHGDGQDSKAYTVSDLAGQRENLGFTQPIALDRLTPVELMPLQEVSEDSRTRIRLDDNGEWREGDIVAQTIDGKVYIKFLDKADPEEVCVDLSTCKYNWV